MNVLSTTQGHPKTTTTRRRKKKKKMIMSNNNNKIYSTEISVNSRLVLWTCFVSVLALHEGFLASGGKLITFE